MGDDGKRAAAAGFGGIGHRGVPEGGAGACTPGGRLAREGRILAEVLRYGF